MRRHGGPEELRLEDGRDPRPAPGEALVRVARAGVNFTDTERRSGRHHDARLPFVPGLEAAGVVDAVGSGDDAHWVGRRVAVMTEACYADRTIARVADLMALPEGISWDEAAAFPIQGLTAYHALHTSARIRAGESVLVHAAAGVRTLLKGLVSGALHSPATTVFALENAAAAHAALESRQTQGKLLLSTER